MSVQSEMAIRDLKASTQKNLLKKTRQKDWSSYITASNKVLEYFKNKEDAKVGICKEVIKKTLQKLVTGYGLENDELYLTENFRLYSDMLVDKLAKHTNFYSRYLDKVPMTPEEKGVLRERHNSMLDKFGITGSLEKKLGETIEEPVNLEDPDLHSKVQTLNDYTKLSKAYFECSKTGKKEGEKDNHQRADRCVDKMATGYKFQGKGYFFPNRCFEVGTEMLVNKLIVLRQSIVLLKNLGIGEEQMKRLIPVYKDIEERASEARL